MPAPNTAQSRRKFLVAAAGLTAGGVIPGFFSRLIARAQTQEGDADREIAEEILARGKTENLSALPIGTLVSLVGKGFTRAPYRAGTLEEPGEEHLVVNLRQFDCVTLVESSLALARALRQGFTDAEGFRRELQTLRYRDGVIRGYPSRLHYFTDWIADNSARKNVVDMSQELGGDLDSRRIHFMTAHRASYPRLDNDADVAAVAETERLLTGRLRYFIPRARVQSALPSLRDGDIIGITSAMEGLDCSHTGLVAREGRVAKFLHAPLSGGRVQISRGSLAEYLAGRGDQTGIVVARPLDPAL
jgi:hypothetical protein